MRGGPGCATGGIFGGIFSTATSRAFRAPFLSEDPRGYFVMPNSSSRPPIAPYRPLQSKQRSIEYPSIALRAVGRRVQTL